MRTASGAIAPLSDVHAMLGHIEHRLDGHEINRIANDPSIYDSVRGYETGRLDLTAAAVNPANVLLVGEHGCIFFHQHSQGQFEAHTMVLPPGRGRWAVLFAKAAVHWLFSHTGAVEIFTRVPKGNKGALGLVRAIGGRYEFERRNGWVIGLDPVSCGIYSRSVFDWIRDGAGLAERGAWFHDRLEREFARLGRTEPQHDDDMVHDRHVGASIEMIFGGQPDKGVLFYNRWAVMAGYEPVAIVAREPLTFNIRNALVIARSDDFWVPALCPSVQQ